MLLVALLTITSLLLSSCPSLSVALKCACTDCPPENQTCECAPHKESTCFKSVERYLNKENNTYELEYRFGCLSGGDSILGPLQCHATNLKHTEPKFIRCCHNEDMCNLDLADPTWQDDPRWNETAPPIDDTTNPIRYTPFSLLPIALVAFITCSLTLCFSALLYKLAIKLFTKYTREDIKSDSQDSICSFKVNLDDQLKSQFMNHQLNHNNCNSSTSTHTYSVSDSIPPKPESPNETSCISIEHSSTYADLTSGKGARVLQERTMASAINSGKTDHVGSGRFGCVFKGVWHGEDVAVKAFRSIDYDAWKREDEIFRKLNHENIVRFIASELVPKEGSVTETWMYLEFCSYGSLCDFLDHHEIYGPQQAIKILYSIINGLNYLHEVYVNGYKPCIAHRDIKSRNILMRTPEVCCIADFGHSVIKINESKLDFGAYQRLQVGTVRYMAPEILKTNPTLDYREFITFAQADLYQFGLVLWEVCHRTALDILHPAGTHKLPYDGIVPQNPDIQDMIKIVCEDQYRPPRSPHWEKYPAMKQLAALMVECWRPNPRARMETLGVKKKIKEMYDQIAPQERLYYGTSALESRTFSLSPNFRNDRVRTRSSDQTL